MPEAELRKCGRRIHKNFRIVKRSLQMTEEWP